MYRFSTASKATRGARKYQEDACAFALIDAATIVRDVATGVTASQPVFAARLDNVEPAPATLVTVLADGMGGHVGGAVASQTACESFITGFQAAIEGEDDPLKIALERANSAIARETAANKALDGMGCTLIGAVFDSAGLRWISVGDSHLFLFRDGELFLLNENHSLAPVLDQLVVDGEMTRTEALNHPRRHYLRSAVTGHEIDLVDLVDESMPLQAGDCVVIASDGIDTLDPDDIADLIESGIDKGPAAVTAAIVAAIDQRAQPHQDNATVVAVIVDYDA